MGEDEQEIKEVIQFNIYGLSDDTSPLISSFTTALLAGDMVTHSGTMRKRGWMAKNNHKNKQTNMHNDVQEEECNKKLSRDVVPTKQSVHTLTWMRSLL